MAGKFMKIKKIIMPVMAVIILTSQLAGCATVSSNEMLEMLNNGQDIEITMAVPNYEITTAGDPQALQDVRLDRLTTYEDIRSDFDKIFGVQNVIGDPKTEKLGCIFIDKDNNPNGNTCFMDSIRNKAFMENHFNKAEVKKALSLMSNMIYADVEEDTEESIYSTLNAYYNLFGDGQTDNTAYFNPTQSVTRGDFYSFVYRATNGIDNMLSTQGKFKEIVGTQAESALYASQVDQYAWLNADNEGLRKTNYDSSISRAEAVYMLMNMYFKAEMEATDISKIKLSDAKDGGELLDDTIESKKESDQLYSLDKKSQLKSMAKGWQLGVISKMMKSPELGVRTEIYQALGLANELGIIETETRYDEPVSKAEAIDMLIKTGEALNKTKGYQSTAGDPVVSEIESDTGTIDGEAYSKDTSSTDRSTFTAKDEIYIVGKQQGVSDDIIMEAVGKDYVPSKEVLDFLEQNPTPPQTPSSNPSPNTKPQTPAPSKPDTKPQTPPKQDDNVWTPPPGFVEPGIPGDGSNIIHGPGDGTHVTEDDLNTDWS